MATDIAENFEEFSLPGYRDGNLNFRGRQFAEFSDLDKDSTELMRLRLFHTDDNKVIYHIVSGAGAAKERRLYVLSLQDDLCLVDNGRQSLSLPPRQLLSLAYALCGVDAAQESELSLALQEGLRLLGAA